MKKDAVIKFPDGKGGYIWKKMDSSGNWVEVNEDGSPIIPIEKEEPPKTVDRSPVKKKAGRPTSRKGAKGVFICLSPSCMERFVDFVHWRSLSEHRDFSKSDIIEEALVLMFRKYPAFSRSEEKKEG